MPRKLIPSARSYLQAFTKLVINRNTDAEHLLSFLSSLLLFNLEAPYSTQWMPLSVWRSYSILCLNSAQYQTSSILTSFCILPRHIYGTSQLGRSCFCGNVLHSFLSPPTDRRSQLSLSVTHGSDHSHLSKWSVCKAACLTRLFSSPAP